MKLKYFMHGSNKDVKKRINFAEMISDKISYIIFLRRYSRKYFNQNYKKSKCYFQIDFFDLYIQLKGRR